MDNSQLSAEVVLAMKWVEFGSVPVGGWFKEVEGGSWHLKVSAMAGRYRIRGVDGEPRFARSELVMVEQLNRVDGEAAARFAASPDAMS